MCQVEQSTDFGTVGTLLQGTIHDPLPLCNVLVAL